MTAAIARGLRQQREVRPDRQRLDEQLQPAHRVCALIETGIIWVNCWLHRDLRTPFGGIKKSGVGREGGKYSLDFYSEAKNICIFLGRD